MDYKEKVEWLGRYQASVSCQHMLEEEIEVLRSDAERVTACMSGMPGRSGPNADRLPRAVERIEEAQKRLEQQLESCMETRAEIMCGIMTVRDRPGQEVLRRRYVMGQNFSEIAEAMGVVQRRAYQLHRTAVEGMASRGFFYTHSGKGGMPLCEIDADHVLDELAEIAFAVPGEEGGLPVKVADKLRALEMLYKHLGLGDGAKTEGVVIVDSES